MIAKTFTPDSEGKVFTIMERSSKRASGMGMER
jgi:hypothetical protein